MDFVELSFPIVGHTLPEDNGYALFSAVSRAIGTHVPPDVAISAVAGPRAGCGKIELTKTSTLRIRTPTQRIAELLCLAGTELEIDGHKIRLAVPRVHALTLAASLYSRLVSIKGFTEPGPFLKAVGRQMALHGIKGRASIPMIQSGPRAGSPRRRVLRIKEVTIVGFALLVEELVAEDSAKLLIHGLGGRRHMGCGIFGPVVRRRGAASPDANLPEDGP